MPAADSDHKGQSALHSDYPDIPEDDGVAYLTFYLDPDLDAGTILAQVREEMEQMRAYVDVGDATIEESETEDVDWVNNWKQ